MRLFNILKNFRDYVRRNRSYQWFQNINNTSPLTLVLPRSFRGLIHISGTEQAREALYSLITTSAGAVAVHSIYQGSSIYLFYTSTDTLTIKSSISANSYVCIAGTITDEVSIGTTQGTTALTVENEFYYKNGDTFSIQGATYCGIITSSSTLVSMTVYPDKSLKNVSSVSVLECVGALRGGSGYVNGSTNNTNWLTVSGITVAAEKLSDRSIRLYFTATSALTNITNNSPVVFYCNLKLSFS